MNTTASFLGILARASWQAAVLVVLVLVAQLLFRRWLSPRWRCALWWLVALRLLLPVAPQSSFSIFNALPRPAAAGEKPGTAESTSVASAEATLAISTRPSNIDGGVAPANAATESGSRLPTTSVPNAAVIASPRQPPAAAKWPTLLFGIWATGVVVLGGHLFRATVRLHRRMAGLQPVTDPAVLACLTSCQEQMAVRTNLPIFETGAVTSPALYGLVQPRLLLPRGFTVDFSAQEQRFVFLHELAHVKRRDIILNWLLAALQIGHWFNPLLWLAAFRFRTDRELACDALALERAGADSREAYGRTILRLLQNLTRPATVPGLVGILEDKRQLRRRIAAIADFKPMKQGAWIAVGLFSALSVVALTDARIETVDRRPGEGVDSSRDFAQLNRERPQNANNEPSRIRVPATGQAMVPTSRPDRVLRGKVVDAETGRPITRFRVGLIGSGPIDQEYTYRYGSVAKDVSSPDGTFSLDFDSTRTNGIPPVNTVEAFAADYFRTRQMIPEAKDGGEELVLKLKRAAPLVGVVVGLDGRSVSGADLVVVDANGASRFGPASLAHGHMRGGDVHTSGPSGQFTFRSPPETGNVIAAHETGFAMVSIDQVRASGRIVLQPYGRIEGVLRIAGEPAVGVELALRTMSDAGISLDFKIYRSKTAASGQFAFDLVPCGKLSILRWVPMSVSRREYAGSHPTEVSVETGQTTQLTLGDSGAVLRGNIRFESPRSPDSNVTITATLSKARPQLPPGLSPDQLRQYVHSPESEEQLRNPKTFWAVVAKDGTLVFDSIPSGDYRLAVLARKEGNPFILPDGEKSGQPLARGEGTVTVPDDATPASPIDLGEIVLNPVVNPPPK